MVDNTRTELVVELQMLLHRALERNITNVPSERAETIKKELLEHAQNVFHKAIRQFLRQQDVAGITYKHLVISDELLKELKNALDEAYARDKPDLFEDLQIVLHTENDRQEKRTDIVEHLQTAIHKAVETFCQQDQCMKTPIVHTDTCFDSSISLSSDALIDSEPEDETHENTSVCPCDIQNIMPTVRRKDLLPLLKEQRLSRARLPVQPINIEMMREIKKEIIKEEELTKECRHAKTRKTKKRVHHKKQSNLPNNLNPERPECVTQYHHLSNDNVAHKTQTNTYAIKRPVTCFQHHTGGERERNRDGYYTERTCSQRPKSESHKIPEQYIQPKTSPSEHGAGIAKETPHNCARENKWLKVPNTSHDPKIEQMPCSSTHTDGENVHLCLENKLKTRFADKSRVNQAVPNNVTSLIDRSKTKYNDLIDTLSEMEKELRESIPSIDSDSG